MPSKFIDRLKYQWKKIPTKKVIGVSLVFFILVGVIYILSLRIPSIVSLKTSVPHMILSKSTGEIEYPLKSHIPNHWVRLSQISQAAVGAIVVSEDWAFFHHRGLDFNQIFKAIKVSLRRGRLVRGASTITQQVVKNVFLSHEKSLIRKFREVGMALLLEMIVGKKKILEVYLNIIELGDGIYGIGAASQHYFNKSAAELSAREGAFLAMLLPSPIRYSVSFQEKKLTPYANKIISSVLKKMEKAKIISEDERIMANNTPFFWEILPFDPMAQENLEFIDGEQLDPELDLLLEEPSDISQDLLQSL